MNYQKYKQCRDMVWRILLNQKISELPISAMRVCENIGISIFDYETGHALISRLGCEEHMCGNDGFSMVWSGKPLIFYDAHCRPTRALYIGA